MSAHGIRRATVVGGGTMGLGIAQALRLGGLDVVLCDADEEATKRAGERLRERTHAQIEAGLREPAAIDAIEQVRVQYPVAEAVAGADLVCEAVFEDVAVKHAVLDQISAATAGIIATNTSSYPIDVLAGRVRDPRRFLGVHWFNPAEWVPGVEVVPGAATDPDVTGTCVDLLRAIGKRPAVVASSPGFIANRLQMALFAEAVSCVAEGLATPEDIDEVVRATFGFRLPHYGPFQIADMAGLDVYLSIYRTLQDGLGDRFAPPEHLRRLVEAGRHGTKTGAGFRDYSPGEAGELVAERDKRYAATARFLAEQGRSRQDDAGGDQS